MKWPAGRVTSWVATGTPEDIARAEGSITGQWLREVFTFLTIPPAVRSEAARSLGHYDPDAAPAIDPLAAALADEYLRIPRRPPLRHRIVGASAVALHVFHYNFCRIHGGLKRTPAMATGVTDRLWSLDDLFG